MEKGMTSMENQYSKLVWITIRKIGYLGWFSPLIMRGRVFYIMSNDFIHKDINTHNNILTQYSFIIKKHF